MCDTNAYVSASGQEQELLLESVDYLRVEDDGAIYLRSLFGEERRVEGRLREIEFRKNRIVIEK